MTQVGEVSTTPPVLVLPDVSDDLSDRLRAGLAAVDALLRREVDHDDAFIAEAKKILVDLGIAATA